MRYALRITIRITIRNFFTKRRVNSPLSVVCLSVFGTPRGGGQRGHGRGDAGSKVADKDRDTKALPLLYPASWVEKETGGSTRGEVQQRRAKNILWKRVNG